MVSPSQKNQGCLNWFPINTISLSFAGRPHKCDKDSTHWSHVCLDYTLSKEVRLFQQAHEDLNQNWKTVNVRASLQCYKVETRGSANLKGYFKGFLLNKSKFTLNANWSHISFSFTWQLLYVWFCNWKLFGFVVNSLSNKVLNKLLFFNLIFFYHFYCFSLFQFCLIYLLQHVVFGKLGAITFSYFLTNCII